MTRFYLVEENEPTRVLRIVTAEDLESAYRKLFGEQDDCPWDRTSYQVLTEPELRSLRRQERDG